MSGTVWTKFYWGDWLSDTGLRRCSLAARGLWIDLLCHMAQHDPIGILAVQGEALSISDVARMAGVSETDASTLISELERNGVFSRDRKGRIYSRRMTRDAKRSAEGQKNGKKGGNPNIGNKKEISEGVNPPVNPGVKGGVNTHIPVANSHKPSSSTAPAGEPLTNLHRMMAADLLDRGKANLSTWERKFLEDLCSKAILTGKMKATLESIASKIGLTADTVLATWRKRLEAARRLQQWDVKWGPPPRQIGCIVPDELLEPGDGQGWSEWRAAS